jgi:hypothetical protein
MASGVEGDNQVGERGGILMDSVDCGGGSMAMGESADKQESSS